MESAQARNVDANFNMTEILSRTEDIDITEKTMEYATMQTIYVASLQTSAKVLQPSLLDYLR
jgi:flagellar hook-associated protein 3 FlgL